METKFTTVTHVDRIAFLLDKQLIQDVEAKKIPWEVIIGLILVGFFATIMIINYPKNKLKEEK